MCIKVLTVFVLLGGLCLPLKPLEACAPAFPPSLLDRPERSVLSQPKPYFYILMQGIIPQSKSPFKALISKNPIREETARAAMSDLAKALKRRGAPLSRGKELLRQFAALRKAMENYLKDRDTWRFWQKRKGWRKNWEKWQVQAVWWCMDHGIHTMPCFLGLTCPATRALRCSARREPLPHLPRPPEARAIKGLPREFILYLKGAVAYYTGNKGAALKAWQALMKLPGSQRKFRSTWAAYMIGSVILKSNPREAARWFARVRALARSGFHDSLGLAAASYGGEGLAELKQKRFVRAIALYLLQAAAGDPGAVNSLHQAARRLAKSAGPALDAAAGNALARQVMTGYYISGNWNKGGRLWLKTLEGKKTGELAGADWLAWLAYQSGDMKLAARWVGRAPRQAPLTQWISSKLLLRRGRLREAAKLLAKVVRGLSQNRHRGALYRSHGVASPPAALAATELAVLKMSRRQYVEALDLFLGAGFWMDAAYVAERVLKPGELAAYVDRRWPLSKIIRTSPQGIGTGIARTGCCSCRGISPRAFTSKASGVHRHSPGHEVRYLLARRLARKGELKKARKYFPKSLLPGIDAYIKAVESGQNRNLSKEERARALWKAARLIRRRGMALMGSELEPDWAICDGQYRLEAHSRARLQARRRNRLVPVAGDEARRLKRHRLKFEKRFHYRYVAANLARAAAGLLPRRSLLAGKMLCRAGMWLKHRDLKAARSFYKELRRRRLWGRVRCSL